MNVPVMVTCPRNAPSCGEGGGGGARGGWLYAHARREHAAAKRQRGCANAHAAPKRHWGNARHHGRSPPDAAGDAAAGTAHAHLNSYLATMHLLGAGASWRIRRLTKNDTMNEQKLFYFS